MRSIALALSLLLVFAFGCTAQRGGSSVQEPPVVAPPSENVTVTAQPCSSGNIVQKDDCFAALARSKSDPEICRNIYSVGTMDSCYSAFAYDNLSICKRITDAELRSVCLTTNAKRINSSESESICGLIDNVDARATCLKQVVPPCQLVLDPDQRALCIALEKNDYNFCTGDSCFAQYAVNRSDANACNLIQSAASKYACIAVVKKDVGECKMAQLAPVQDYCIEMAAEKLGILEGCGLATSGSDYSNRCYLYFAVKGKQSSICASVEPEFSIGSGTSRYWCYSEYALRTSNTGACAKITESLNRISCYYNAAASNSMPSLCNPLSVDSQRRDCYAKGVQTLRGPVPSDCQFVDDNVWKDKCFYKAAIATANRTLCGFIAPSSPDRGSCDSSFGQ